MRIFFWCLFLILTGAGGLNQTYATIQTVSFDEGSKIYVSPEQIQITKDGIFVVLEFEYIQIQAIMQDDQGIHYLKIPPLYWTCRKCGYSGNPPWINYCQQCGRHYAEEDEDEA